MKKKINIGWIGSGFIGQVAHLRNFHLNKNINISAISELRPNLAKNVQKKYNIHKFYDDYKKMIIENNFDASSNSGKSEVAQSLDMITSWILKSVLS